MQAAAGDRHFSEASLVNQDSHGLNLTLSGNGGQYFLDPGTKVAGPFVTRRFSRKFCQSSPTYGRLSHYDSSHEACAVFEN
jgi:hypothetical protein